MKFTPTDYLHPKYWPVWIAIALLRVISLLPWRLKNGMGFALGALIHAVAPGRSKVIRTNLDICYPELSDKERKQLAWKNSLYSGLAFMDIATLWHISEKEIEQRTTIHGIEHLDAVWGKGPVLLLSNHSLFIEASTHALSCRGYTPLQGMYKPTKNKLFDDYMSYSRSKSHADAVLVPNNQFKYFVSELSNGKASYYFPDQHFRKNTMMAPFFGVETASLTATSYLVSNTKATVLPICGYRNKDNTGYDIFVLPALQNFPVGEDLQDTITINQTMEALINLGKEQYMWGHKRFKQVGPEGKNAYDDPSAL